MITVWPTTLFFVQCVNIETKSVYEIKSDTETKSDIGAKSDIETNLPMKPGLSIEHERRDNVAVRLSCRVSIRTVGIQLRQCISLP